VISGNHLGYTPWLFYLKHTLLGLQGFINCCIYGFTNGHTKIVKKMCCIESPNESMHKETNNFFQSEYIEHGDNGLEMKNLK